MKTIRIWRVYRDITVHSCAYYRNSSSSSSFRSSSRYISISSLHNHSHRSLIRSMDGRMGVLLHLLLTSFFLLVIILQLSFHHLLVVHRSFGSWEPDREQTLPSFAHGLFPIRLESHIIQSFVALIDLSFTGGPALSNAWKRPLIIRCGLILDRRPVQKNESDVGDGKHYQGQTKDSCQHHASDLKVVCPCIVRVSHIERNQGRQNENTVDGGVCDEQYKELVVLLADTVQNPRTVMVHLQHATLADSTMMRSFRFDMSTTVTPQWMRLSIEIFANVNISCSMTSLCSWDQYAS